MDFKGLAGWVSLMVPCYNGERFVERFIRNLAEQTYSKIHLIFVDDGSADKTYDRFMQYRCLLDDKGIQWEYHYQENQGQAAAINKALPRVRGEYCLWLDVDDTITKDHIEKKVNRLNEDKELGIVVCRGIAVDDDNPSNILYEISSMKKTRTGCLFEDILFDYAGCLPGLFMVRSNLLLKALNGKGIYPSRVGQNFQLLLPITYQFKAGYIDKVLFFYRVRPDSHFHSVVSENDWQKRIELVEDVKRNTLIRMPLSHQYLQLLLEALRFKIIKMKIDVMIERSDDTGKSKFASGVVAECFRNLTSVSEKELWIWGETEKNYKLAKLIEVYGNVEVKGFVESNPVKVERKIYGREVISPDGLNVDNMVLLIPLMFHEEIVSMIDFKGFVSGKDFLYPEYEIVRRLKENRNEICQKKRGM